jgi:hypothetical protein
MSTPTATVIRREPDTESPYFSRRAGTRDGRVVNFW